MYACIQSDSCWNIRGAPRQCQNAVLTYELRAMEALRIIAPLPLRLTGEIYFYRRVTL